MMTDPYNVYDSNPLNILYLILCGTCSPFLFLKELLNGVVREV